MKKFIAGALVCLFGISLFLVGCTSGNVNSNPSQEEKIKLTMWSCDGSPAYVDPLQKFADDYMAMHENVEIEIVGLPYDTNVEKFDVAVATHTAPDLAYYECNNLQSYIDQGALVDLNTYFNEWDQNGKFDRKRIDIPGYVQGDSRYYFPIEFAAATMMYRKDLFEEKGITLPLKTWDDIFDAADHLTDADNGVYGYSFRMKGGASRLEAFLLAYTGAESYFDENGKCFVRDEKAVEGLERFASMYLVNSADDMANGNNEACAALISGTAAMSYLNTGNYPWMCESAPADSLAAYILPAAENGNTVLGIGINQGGGGISIFKDSKHPDVAWDFMAFMLEEKQNSYWNEMAGAFPINMDAYDEEWIENSQPHADLRDKIMEENTVVVASPFYLKGYKDIFNNILNPGFQQVVLGEKTAEAYLTEWADAMEKANAA